MVVALKVLVSKISAPASMIMWGAAINDQEIFDNYLKKLLKVLTILDKKKYFAKEIRHNNEAMHHLVQISEILRLNNYDLYNKKIRFVFMGAYCHTHSRHSTD